MFTAESIRDVAGDSIFAVKFRKRSDQSIREMNCRLGVKKHLTGGDRPYDDRSHGLLTVFDLKIREYRSIPLDGILEVRANGRILTPR
jgi:hypothetical protein